MKLPNFFKLFWKAKDLSKDTVDEVIKDLDREINYLSLYVLPEVQSRWENRNVLAKIDLLRQKRDDLKRRYKKASKSKSLKVVQDVVPSDKTILNTQKQAYSSQVAMRKSKYSVVWDTDGESVDLPKIVDVPDNVPEEDVADWLSNKYGWLVSSLTKLKMGTEAAGQIPNSLLSRQDLEGKRKVKKAMSVEEAKNIIGDRAKWELEAMKRALSSMQFLNTDEENKKLEAVNVLLRNLKEKSQISKKEKFVIYEGKEVLNLPAGEYEVVGESEPHHVGPWGSFMNIAVKNLKTGKVYSIPKGNAQLMGLVKSQINKAIKMTTEELKGVLPADVWKKLFQRGNPSGYVTYRIGDWDIEWHPNEAIWYVGWSRPYSNKSQINKATVFGRIVPTKIDAERGQLYEAQILVDGKVVATSVNVPDKSILQSWLDKNLPDYKRNFETVKSIISKIDKFIAKSHVQDKLDSFIEDEKEGAKEYWNAAEETSDLDNAKKLMHMALDEERHEDTLRGMKKDETKKQRSKSAFSSTYKGYRIDVYENEDGSFIAAIDDTIENSTAAHDIKTAFKNASGIIERRLENAFGKQQKMFDVEQRSDGMWYVVDYTMGRKNIVNAFRTKREAENLANELNRKTEEHAKSIKSIDAFVKKYAGN